MSRDAPETQIVTALRIACDGGAGGHPRVWLQITEADGFVECRYCDKRFILKGGPADDAATAAAANATDAQG
jgi:uncharacterized Zn-finger protein